MMSWRTALDRLLHKPDEPVFVDLTESARRSAVREAEYQAAVEADCKVIRTSSYCRRLPRRSLAGLVERVRGRV